MGRTSAWTSSQPERVTTTAGTSSPGSARQGSPVAAEGNLLHVAKIAHGLPPAGAKLYQAWDLAISEKTTADWSVGTTIAVDEDQNVYLVDERRGRWGFNDLLGQMEVKP